MKWETGLHSEKEHIVGVLRELTWFPMYPNPHKCTASLITNTHSRVVPLSQLVSWHLMHHCHPKCCLHSAHSQCCIILWVWRNVHASRFFKNRLNSSPKEETQQCR
jgi:hypothetical protein